MTLLATSDETAVMFPRENLDLGDYAIPDSHVAQTTAMRTVVKYLIVESFDLTEEETLWADWVLDDVFSELLTVRPRQMPVAVRQELLKGSYTKLLKKRCGLGGTRAFYDDKVIQASADEWATALMLPITESYDLNPITEMRMRATLIDMLADFGVGDSVRPRGATYLPTELRQRILNP